MLNKYSKMMKRLESPYISLIARIIVGGMFIVVGMGKLAQPQTFVEEIANYRMLPEILVNLMAVALPWIEVIAGILFIAGVRIRANATILGGLLIMFIAGVAVAMMRGLDINCGCYSQIASQKVGWPKILENTGLLLLVIYSYIFPSKRFTLEQLTIKEANRSHA